MTRKEEKIFTKKLKKAMAEQYITQTELARRLGLAQASVSAWLHDKSKPEFSLLEKIAEATNKPINYFFSDDSTTQIATGNNNTQTNAGNTDLELIKKDMEVFKKTLENLDLRLKLLEKEGK